MSFKTIDNINITLLNDLQEEIRSGSKVEMIANQFSIYAYEKLKKELDKVESFNFIFNEPSFIVEAEQKERREFFIPKNDAEKSLSGTDFEIKLKNELTLKAVAKECGEWLKKKAHFKSNITNGKVQTYMLVNNKAYMPIDNFTTVELGLDKGNYISQVISKSDELYQPLKQQFDLMWNDEKIFKDVSDKVLENIVNCYKENSPQCIYYLSLYNIFNSFLEELDADVLPKEKTGFKDSVIWNKLYDFQKDAVRGIINKLEIFNGCILADSVGLGKTFTALAVIKYYELRNDRVLVLCPKKLENNWKTYTNNYTNNILVNDRFNYDVLFHTDLNREKGESSGMDLERVNWGNYDLVVIDESHNFRNGTKNAKGKSQDEGKLNRYEILMKKVMQSGVQTKVLMLSATPVNNRFIDLRNQLALAYEGKSEVITKKMNLRKDIDYVFKDAQAAFNEWSKIDPKIRTTKTLLDRLNMDFFTILDNVTIARSRKHIVNYYDSTKIGKFPIRLKPLSYNPDLTDIEELISFREIGDILNRLTLCVYIPTHFVLPQKLNKYEELYDTVVSKSVVLSQKTVNLGQDI